ncbi:MAG: 5'-nucleotidase C-terminal domain-containing protein [Acidobacteriota bacterium]
MRRPRPAHCPAGAAGTRAPQLIGLVAALLALGCAGAPTPNVPAPPTPSAAAGDPSLPPTVTLPADTGDSQRGAAIDTDLDGPDAADVAVRYDEATVSAQAALQAVDGSTMPARHAVLLAINDVYRADGVDGGRVGGLARVGALRQRLAQQHPDLITLLAGDFLSPSLLSRLTCGAHMIDALNHLDGDAEAFDERFFVAYGNHEFDNARCSDARTLAARVAESDFAWLNGNIRFGARDGSDCALDDATRAQLDATAWSLIDSGGVRVGLFGLTLKDKHPDYVARFDAPIATARAITARLRAAGAEVVIALTHQTIGDDAALLRALGDDGPDLIVGGHEHVRQSEIVRGRRVIKADADARTATLISIAPGRDDGPPRVRHQYVALNDVIAPDGVMQRTIDDWRMRHAATLCGERASTVRCRDGLGADALRAAFADPADPSIDADCLDQPLSVAGSDLIAEEQEIRRFETNLGDWVLDLARSAFPRAASDPPTVAFLNAGTLRLNQDIARGTALTRRLVEELFAYPAPLVRIAIDGRTLRDVLATATASWTGQGHWLQIAGFAFRHDPDGETPAERVRDLVRVDAAGTLHPIADDDPLIAVTIPFLADGNDGYAVLATRERLDPPDAHAPDLKHRVLTALTAAGDAGIAPVADGRICNVRDADRPCLVGRSTNAAAR